MATRREELQSQLDDIEQKLSEARAKGPGANVGPVGMDWVSYMAELRKQRKEIKEELEGLPFELESQVDFPEE